MMQRFTAALTVVDLALILGLSLAAPPAAADSFFFGYSSGYRHHRHYGHHHYPHYWRPRYHYGYYYYPPPPVVYAPPPVVYAPPPVVYAPAPLPPLAAVPTSPVYRASNGQYCREYQATVRVDGVPQPSHGTACLQPDGTWRVVN
jgi:hypothetical protein